YGTQEATRNSDSVRFSSADSWMRNGAGIRQSVHNLFILQNIGYTYLCQVLSKLLDIHSCLGVN
ncbi:MAG: hypothetical protein AAF703_23900, partial [Cyanobacteria bacterium P01_D01_bin.105]